MSDPVECPTKKIGFASRAEAQLVIKHWRGRKGPVHVYRCECGMWHITGMSKRESRKSRKRV